MAVKNEQYNSDNQLSFGSYWDKYKYEIANNRSWNCTGDCARAPQCFSACPRANVRSTVGGTLYSYNRYIHFVDNYLDGPISEISFFDICSAIGRVREEQGYSFSTASTIASAVRRVFEYASERGDAYNVTEYTTSGRGEGADIDSLLLFCSGYSDAYIREELQKEQDRLANITKSLTIRQLERLSSILWKNIELDGRYCLLCLMLYAGIRPAEGRALRWKDITPFIDHPDRTLINIYRIRDAKGNLHDLTKSDNAYRRVPAHIELMHFLAKRYEFVVRHSTESVEEFPICCMGNDLARPCRDYEVATLAKSVFMRLKLTQTSMYAYEINRLCEHFNQPKEVRNEDGDQHLTLYVLRRNFWTWLQSSTQLSDDNKRLIMGHELSDGHSRKEKNDENLLWNICRQIDACVISKKQHEPHLLFELDEEKPIIIDNQGICRIHLSAETLTSSSSIHFCVTAEEPGEEICLKVLSPVHNIGNIRPDAHAVGFPPQKDKIGINCQQEIWLAHNNLRKQKSPDSLSDPETAEEQNP